jgi:hypothetical protein
MVSVHVAKIHPARLTQKIATSLTLPQLMAAKFVKIFRPIRMKWYCTEVVLMKMI